MLQEGPAAQSTLARLALETPEAGVSSAQRPCRENNSCFGSSRGQKMCKCGCFPPPQGRRP